MKKVLSYILISFILLANLLAPVSVGFDSKNKIKIQENTANALNFGDIVLTIETLPNDKEIGINVSVDWAKNTTGTANGVQLILTSPDGSKQTKYASFPFTDSFSTKQTTSTPVLFTGLTPGATYSLKTTARLSDLGLGVSTGSGGDNLYLFPTDSAGIENIKDKINETVIEEKIQTKTTYIQNVVVDKKVTKDNIDRSQQTTMPACSTGVISFSIGGCVAQFVYYVLFVPTSYLFALAGTFFDYTFAYSINDTSYRSAFVVQGWGLVRDFCNMFFIFVMLYIAISTILNVHGFKTKETIINVVIIGLFINFSLFATQVIIDASNITARVFYNSDAIKITVKGQSDNTLANATDGGTIMAKEDENGIISLSEALVNKVNPQNIIINAGKVNDIQSNSIANSSINTTGAKEESDANMGAGTFILIVFLAVAINVVGIIVFTSVGLIFVTRVIGLWLAMILAPLAFFTYIIPSWADTKTIGWKSWWSNTIKLAFLAPVFIFFMYIILKFLQANLIADPINATTGLSFFVATIIPFAFIMILMLKAKDLASDMSGEMGQKITGGVAAAGGFMLGGAAMGTAFLGRQTVGAFMKGASTGDSANQRFARSQVAGAPNEMRGRWDTFKGAVAHYGTFGRLTAAQRGMGNVLNRDQTRVEGYAHARHLLDENSQTRYHKKYSELTQNERQTVHDVIDNNILSRARYGNRNYAQLTDAERVFVDADRVAGRAAGTIQHGSAELVGQSRGKQGLISSVAQSTRNGSFDVRELSKLTANEYDRNFSKFMTGATSALAGGMRSMFKQSNINYGQGQKDFVKDLGHTISEALKSTTIKVDLSHVGDEKKEDGHGGHH